jgi:hypothetical protein
MIQIYDTESPPEKQVPARKKPPAAAFFKGIRD